MSESADRRPAGAARHGRPPRGYRLPAATRLGHVRLQVADLERSLAFYRDVLGLRVAHRAEARLSLAAHGGERVLLELHERPGARAADRPARLGLFHVALLLPDRRALGQIVTHLVAARVHFGAGDHLVSEAIYLTDPDGLGLEVYADRPRSAWRRTGDELAMTTDPVDLDALMAAARGHAWTGMPPATVVGHVHLHVGDLDGATAFYAEAVGFDRTVWSYPGALFLSAGGYHHHLGVNTWAGPAARPAGDGDARLLAWSLELPTDDDVAALAGNLAEYGRRGTLEDGELVTEDPWGTRLRVRAAIP